MSWTDDRSSRPNVLWITMEDTSPRFGCYGDDVARTPNIDRLASEGRQYPNAFSTAGACAPSRAAVMTGMYQNSIGCHHHRTGGTYKDVPSVPTPYEAVPPHYVSSISEYFRRAGYYCTLNEKSDYQFGEPFTMWDEHGSEAHWRNRPDDRPFFAMFNNTVTHGSGMWPEGGETIETDPDEVDVPPYLPDTAKARRALARHYDNIAVSDEWIGRLLKELGADGLRENTAVFLWSDHGEGLPRAKGWVYDSGTNVPLVVRWPGEVDPGVDDRLVGMLDLGPTALSVAGLDIPRHMQGRPFLGSHGQPPREYVYAASDRTDEVYDMIRTVRDDQYRYIRNYRPGTPYRQWLSYRNQHPIREELLELDAADDLRGAREWIGATRPAEELYDLEADPHEIENLVDNPEHAGTLDRLRGALNDWMDRIDDLGAEDETSMVHRWYGGQDQPRTSTPTFVPNAPGNREWEATPGGAMLEAPATVSIHCPTQGASIGYTTDDGDDPHWELYSGPIRLDPGETTLRAKAVRYGYAESDERTATFPVRK